MALSFEAVKIAFQVFNKLELKDIRSFPPEFYDLSEHEQKNPREECTYGIDRKSDNGWENLFFFKKSPSKDFIERWNSLKDQVPNSSFEKLYEENPEYMIFGWF